MDQAVPTPDGSSSVRVKGATALTDSLDIATPHDRNNVPIFVTSSYLLNYDGSFGNQQCGFPFFSNVIINDGDQTRIKGANQFILTDSSSDNWDFEIRAVDDNLTQISDYNWTYKDDQTGFFNPKGANVTLFEPTYESTSEASKLMLLDMFSYHAN